MNNNNPVDQVPRGLDALQARFALRVTAALGHLQAATPTHDIDTRLRFAREQALARARDMRRAAALSTAAAIAPALIANGDGTARLAGGDADTPWWLRLGVALPLVVLLAGLTLVETRYAEAQVEAAVEVDAAILGDELPPEAYSDAGFVEFLKIRQ